MDSITSENITNEFLAFNQSQWTSNGSNIYLNSSVGIGTSLPRANLDVYGTVRFGSSLNVSGNANVLGNLTVSNLIVTGNLVNVTTNTQFSNSVTINNAGTSTALKVVQLENVPVHTNNVAEFWDYQTLALLINGDGNVGIHTTLINPHAFAVVGSSNLDYIKTINVYSSNAVAASNLYGNVVGSNTVSASGLYGPVVGSNTVSASGLYGPIAGSNTISASTIYGQLAGSNTIAGSSLTLDTALSIGNGGTGQTTKSAAFNSLSPMTTAGDLIYGGTSGSGTRLATGTTTQILHGGTTPSWSAVSLTADVSGTLPVANGGTNLTTYTSGGLIYASGTGTLASSGAYTSGQILYGGGAGSAPGSSTSLLWDSVNLRLGIGTSTTPTYAIDIFDQNNSMMRLSQYNSTDGPVIRAYRALGTFSVPTGVTADTVLFATRGFGYNSSSAFSGRCVGIEMCAAETFTGVATGTYMRFDTCASGTTTNSEKMRLTGSGYLGIGVTPTSPLHIVSTQTTQSRIVTLDGSGQSTIDTGILINSGTGKNPYIDFQLAGVLKCNMYWDSTNSRMVHNGQSTTNYFAGALKTATNSTNYVVGTGTAVTVNTTTPTTVASVTITTVGKPVFIICCGDLQPVSGAPANDWCNMRLYQGASTTIGNATLYHPGTAASTNHMFSIHAIDVPAAGTYTYTCKAWQGVGSIQFGEVGVPYIVAWEFI